MLQFRLLGFPIVIHWIFWLNTALMGGALGADSPEAFRGMLAWMLACFVSILIHELGHALAMRSFGDRSVAIVLYAFGGFARGSRLFTRSQDLQLTAAGPGLQIACGLAVGWAMTIWPMPVGWPSQVASAFTEVSLFWALLNLAPILPLDGGRLCAAFFGRIRPALVISIIFAVLLAFICMQSHLWVSFQNRLFETIDIPIRFREDSDQNFPNFVPLLFFGFLAYNNWKQLQGEPQIPWMDAR